MNQIIFIPQTIHNPKFTSPWFFLHVYCGYLLQTYPRQIAEDLFFITTEHLIKNQNHIIENSIELLFDRTYLEMKVQSEEEIKHILKQLKGKDSYTMNYRYKKIGDINYQLLEFIYGEEVYKHILK